MSDLTKFKAERDALFRNPTLEAATAHFRKHGLPFSDPLVPLAATHKARLQWLDATDDMLAESERWLIENGCSAMIWNGVRPLTPAQRDIERMMHGKRPLMGVK